MTRTSQNSAIWTKDTPSPTDVQTGPVRFQNGPVSTISLGTVRANYRALRNLSPQAETGAVVKADAYGHGLPQIGAALVAEGCETFFVAYAEEGTALRNAVGPEPKIYVFHGVTEETSGTFLSVNLTPVCNSPREIKLWQQIAPGRAYAAHFDTGMNRLGIRPADVDAVLSLAEVHPPELVMSHLACADQPDHPMNAQQLRAFQKIASLFPKSRKSFSSTGGIYLGKEYQFDLVRPGIGLYGGGPAYPSDIRLTPALRLEASVISVFDAAPEATSGYGATFTAKRPTRLATLALGYADGYLRSASNYGFAMLQNTPCPIVGRVSMDLVTIDVSDVEGDIAPGTHAEFIGPKAGLEIQAQALGTIGYELTTRLGGRISRRWVEEEF